MQGWGERYCNNLNYVKNNAFFKQPSMRACSSTPPKQNQDFVKEHNRTPLMHKQVIKKKKIQRHPFNLHQQLSTNWSGVGQLDHFKMSNSIQFIGYNCTCLGCKLVRLTLALTYRL